MTDAPIDPDVLARIGALADRLRAAPDADLARQLEFVVDVLIARGHLTPGHRRILDRLRTSAAPKVKLAVFRDKRSVPSADVDCAALLHLCHARCCAMQVSLSAEDLDEGRLRWDLHDPYVLPKAATGRCIHTGDDGSCGVYADRPGACRAYDCRDDPRVWLDFTQRLPAPLPPHIAPLGTV